MSHFIDHSHMMYERWGEGLEGWLLLGRRAS